MHVVVIPMSRLRRLRNWVVSLNPLHSGNIPAYVITDTNILKKVLPYNNNIRAIDTDQYETFQLYLKNFANPFRINISERKSITANICPECNYEFDRNERHFQGEVIFSDKYKNIQEERAIKDLVSATPSQNNTLLYILAGSMIMNVIFAVLIGVT